MASLRWCRRYCSTGSQSAGRANRRAGERGAAVSFWVLLMVPWAVFAAVAAMSIPQRMGAESTMRAASDDLAALHEHHQLFDVGLEVGDDPAEFSLATSCAPPDPGSDVESGAGSEPWAEACRAVMRDLGLAGVNLDSLRGFYFVDAPADDDLSTQDQRWWLCTPDGADSGTNVSDTYVSGTYVVALVSDWDSAGWAPAQVWPEGRRIGSQTPQTSEGNCPDGARPLDKRGRLSG